MDVEPVGDSETYKIQVEEAKSKLRRQVAILVVASFVVSIGVFLAFNWVIQI